MRAQFLAINDGRLDEFLVNHLSVFVFRNVARRLGEPFQKGGFEILAGQVFGEFAGPGPRIE